MRDVVVIGAGGMAKEIWGLCISVGFSILGFVVERTGYPDTFMGLPILATDTKFLMAERRNCVIANGTPDTRRKIAGMYLGSAHDFPNVIHHAAVIFGEIELGQGVTIMPGGVIQPDVKIDNFVHINMGVTIGHDVTIGPYSVINHNAGISGNVRIGETVLIGAGAIIIEGNTIGDGATVGAGAVITKDVPPGETWVGVPARKLEKRIEIGYDELYGETR
jgi:sugar O-acyltransferase (sialic acid O-acetyltransferase NeuD family)